MIRTSRSPDLQRTRRNVHRGVDAGTRYYDEAIKRVKAAWDTGVFKGVLWHQGEGNETDTDYHLKLTKLIA